MMSMARNPGTGNFYVRRFFRIYPLSVLIVVIVTIFHIPPTPVRPLLPFNIFNLLSNICLTTNLTYTPVWVPYGVSPWKSGYSGPAASIWLTKKSNAFRNILLLGHVLCLAYIHLISRRLDIIQFVPCFVSGDCVRATLEL